MWCSTADRFQLVRILCRQLNNQCLPAAVFLVLRLGATAPPPLYRPEDQH
jgi:hypothetical protein